MVTIRLVGRLLPALLLVAACGGDPRLGENQLAVNDAFCLNKNPGDPCDRDANVCTVDTCQGAQGSLVCTFTGSRLPAGSSCNADSDPCTIDHCGNTNTGLADGICHHDFTPGATCNDTNPCTTGDTCTGTAGSHACVGNAVPNFPPVPCTSDGLLCSIDQCRDGVCEHVPDNTICADANECTTDLCDPANPNHDPITGCVNDPAAPSTPCSSDGIFCTFDHCSGDASATCLHLPINARCNDLVDCTGDVCDATLGCLHTPNDAICDDGNVCNGAETCDPSAGNANGRTGCVPGADAPPGTACQSDNIPCTVDVCDGSGQCLHSPDNGQCDDMRTCTTDTCSPTLGCVFTPNNAVCNDSNPCTTDVCNPSAAGSDPTTGCANPPLPAGTACTDDMVACTVDQCNATGQCTHSPNNGACADTNPCTEDLCDPAQGCQHPAVSAGTPCSDNNMCTTGDRCVGTLCTPTGALNCDDGNPCTLDSCSASAGCQSTPAPATTSCEDGNACTIMDHCNGAGGCVAGVVRNCDDGNRCTTDSCDPASGCVNNPIPGCCGSDTDCRDNNACTLDRCNTATGTCSNDMIPGCCNESSECADNDVCTVDVCGPQHTCEHGPILGCCTTSAQCADQTICTADACDPVTNRCTHTPLANCCTSDTQCDDGNPCTDATCNTETGTCSYQQRAGCCVTGADCDDKNPCTSDICAPDNTCQNPAIDGCCRRDSECGDGQACTTDTCDPNFHICTHAGVPGCCTRDQDCATGDPCTVGTCDRSTGTCQLQEPPGCCRNDADCDDANVCTSDTCDPSSNQCSHAPITSGGCCGMDGDCNDMDVCTQDACNTTLDVCDHEAISACCHMDFECNDSMSCTQDSCDPNTHQCSFSGQCDGGTDGPPVDAGADGPAQDGGRNDGAAGDGGLMLHGTGGCACEVASHGEAGAGGAALLAAAALLFVRLRRRQSRAGARTAPRGRVLLLFALGFALGRPAPARADAVDVELFHPASGWDRYLSLEGAAPTGHLLLMAGASMSWAKQPLVATVGGQDQTIIDNRFGVDINGAIGLWNHLLLSIDVPFVPHQSGNLMPVSSDVGGQVLNQEAVGDLRLGIKGVLGELRAGDTRFGAALAAVVTMPSGDQDNLAGSRPSFQPHVIFDVRQRGFGAAVSFGGVIREERNFENLGVGSQLLIGAGVRVPLYRDLLSALGEIYGWVPTSGDMVEQRTPFEALGGLRLRLQEVELTAAAGRGLDKGYGTPEARVIAGVAFAPRPPEPRPMLAHEEPPPPPPKPLDTDGDGILDEDDKCPTEPGPRENQGCPDKDRDGDGIIDRLDKCPDQPGPKENDGCPDKDTDGDGIVDRLDKCPNEPETFNGFQDEDGCPDKGPELAVLTKDKIEIKQPVYFKTGKAVIEKRSFTLLTTVGTLLKLHPELRKVQVQGHTDSRGKHEYNMKLSRDRSNAVVAHLVLVIGIDPSRLEAEGFGPDKPVAPNSTRAGRSLNRRVEFVIVERGENPLQPATNAPAVPKPRGAGLPEKQRGAEPPKKPKDGEPQSKPPPAPPAPLPPETPPPPPGQPR